MTREEAIEVVRKTLPHLGIGATEMTDALGTLIPELKESEDERIRKGIIEIIKAVSGPDCDVYLDEKKQEKYLAWLEKQKEPLPIPDKFSGLKSLMLQYFDSAVHRNADAEIESDTDLWGRKILDYVWKYSDEQKEQKPEWSEEDEAMRDNILRLLSCFVGTSECDSNPSLSTSYPAYQREMDWLKSLRPSWKPSEEQMEALEAATVRYQSTGLESLYEDLKKLRIKVVEK